MLQKAINEMKLYDDKESNMAFVNSFLQFDRGKCSLQDVADIVAKLDEKAMKTESQHRNTPDNTDDKLIKVLEYFLSLHEADEIFNIINDPKFEVEDVIKMLENYEDENYINPNE